jgi:hypothetical protein
MWQTLSDSAANGFQMLPQGISQVCHPLLKSPTMTQVSVDRIEIPRMQAKLN